MVTVTVGEPRNWLRRTLLGGLAMAVCAGAFALLAGEEAEGGKKRVTLNEARVELGRRLFFDPMVSKSGAVSCASCHSPAHGFSDPKRFSQDDTGMTPRHSQVILDSAQNPSAHWDGEFDSIEDLVVARLGRQVVYYGGPSTPFTPTTPGRPPPRPPGPITGGTVSFTAVPGTSFFLSDEVPLRLMANAYYQDAFKRAFGSSKITLAKLGDAIAEYCHSIQSTESPFDRFQAGDDSALTDSARRGFELFKNKAGCAQCHKATGKHPLFTDYAFHNTGIAYLSGGGGAADRGRETFSKDEDDLRAFKTPTLRDLTRRQPYMHDGRFKTLEEVIRYYAAGCRLGGSADPKLDRRIRPFEITDDDVRDLTAFLRSLTGDEVPGLAKEAWSARPKETKLRFLNAEGKPIAGLKVELVPFGQAIPVQGRVADMEDVLDLTTDDKGRVSYAPPPWTHYQIDLPDALSHLTSDLVPDTCRKQDIYIPVLGRGRLLVVVPASVKTPETLKVRYTDSTTQVAAQVTVVVNGKEIVAPDRSPFTLFRRLSEKVVGDKRIARYEGWVRSEKVPGSVRLWGTKDRQVQLEVGKEVRLDYRE